MSPGAVARRTFASLKIRNYRIYFAGQIVSMTGTWVQITAQMWLVLQLSHSAVALGVVSALQFLPILIAGAWGGVVADRFDKRKALIGTQAAGAAISLVLGLITIMGVAELWMVYSLAFLMGCALVVEVPARQAFVIEMVGQDHLANALGLNSTVFTTARVAGPAIAAVVIATVGIGWSFVINAVSFLAVIAALRAMDTDALRTRRPDPEASKPRLIEGLRYAWGKPALRSSLLLMGIVGTLAFNFRVLLPVMADEVFGGGAAVYGTLSSVMGAGTLAGALIAAAWAKPTRGLLVGSAIAFGVLIILGAMAPNLATALIVLFPLGAASIVFVATCNGVLQLNSSDAMRGRVMALYSVLFLGTTPIGGPLVGWLAEVLGPRRSFAFTGIATVAGGLAALRALRKARMLSGERVPDTAVLDPAGAGSSAA